MHDIHDPSVPQSGVAADDAGPRDYPVEFTGTGAEYFRIWIVNLLLTIVTLGIYSAWAKVRRKRYFHGHTRIDGEGFEYLANPVSILKGRIIAVLVLSAQSLAGKFSPITYGVISLLILIALPWLIVRTYAFNAYNSSYRNVRFHFRRRYGQAAGVLFGLGLLSILTLGALLPYMKSRFARLIMTNHQYGLTPFQMAPVTRGFYGIYIKAFVMLLLTFAGVGLILWAGNRAHAGPGTMLFIPFFYGALLLIMAYGQTRLDNLVWNHATLGPLSFEYTQRARDMAWIYVSNAVMVLCTLGLAMPWALVRMSRYRATHMTVVAATGFDGFVADESVQVGAAGDAMTDLFDFDIGW